MKKLKKISLFICSFVLVLTGLFFAACKKPDYSNVNLTAYVGDEIANSVNIDKGGEAVITFRINGWTNKMNGELNLNPMFDTTDCFTYQAYYNGDGVTTVIINGVTGGKAHLHAVTIDGGKSCDVEIIVNEYSDFISNNNYNLFVTNSTDFEPSALDFNFKDESTKRDVDFYFYGVASEDGKDLTLDDVKTDDKQLYQKFDKVYLINQNDNDYLIFENNGQLYSLSSDVQDDEYANVHIPFITATKNDDRYDFVGGTPRAVYLGDRFTFIANYINNSGDEIYTQRDFYVLKDLNGDQITYSYNFDTSHENPTKYSDKLVLIPNRYDFDRTTNHYTDYKTVKMEVTLPTDSDLVEFDFETPKIIDKNGDEIEILNIVKNPTGYPVRVEEGKTTYTLRIANISTISASSKLVLNVYYKGFGNIANTDVNCQVEIPVEIKFQPETITVNNSLEEENRTYTFYNNYATLDVGWQAFEVRYAPNDAVVSDFEVTFNTREVMMRYRNERYTSANTTVDENGMATVVLSELNDFLYFKGVNDEANLQADGTINVKLNYNLIDEPQSKSYNIKYAVIQGARNINFEDREHASRGVYTPVGEQTYSFTGLYTTAYFESFSFELSDIASSGIVQLTSISRIEDVDNGIYKLEIGVRGLKVGSAKYNVILDNGTTVNVTFNVVESLDEIEAVVESDTGSVTNVVNTKPNYDNDVPGSTLVYIRNRNLNNEVVFGEKAVVNLLANGNRESTAIINTNFIKNGQGLSVQEIVNKKVSVNLTTTGVGESVINYTLFGYAVDENFKLVSKSLNYQIIVISYNLIDGLDVIKTHDGLADYDAKDHITAGNVTVYFGTSNATLRTATFQVEPKQSGFFFLNPLSETASDTSNHNSYDSANFDNRYVYWRANVAVRKNGALVSDGIMTYNPDSADGNRYTLDGCGTFDTRTMTFEAFDYASLTLQLIATVRQFDRPYSFTINITSREYTDVSRLSLQESDKNTDLTFTASQRTKELVLITTPRNATNPKLDKVFFAPVLQYKNKGSEDVVTGEFRLFDETINGITTRNSGIVIGEPQNGVVAVTLTITDDFINFINGITDIQGTISGEIVFASADWIAGNAILPEYTSRCVRISVSFADGSKENPYSLETPEDVLNINDRPDAHYKLSTTIDMSMFSNQLPIKAFSGSITGYTAQAQIIGIEVTNASNENYFGLFSELENGALIDGVKFKGSINVAVNGNAHIGLIAGLLNKDAMLINVGVELTESKVTFESLTENGVVYVGGVVGRNLGTIKQDYRLYNYRKLTKAQEIAIENKYQNLLNGTTDQDEIKEINEAIAREKANEEAKLNKLYGRTPNILLYGDKLKIENKLDVASSIYIGGVTGYNNGKILKYDTGRVVVFDDGTEIDYQDDEIELYGYSDYLAYLNIEISGNNTKARNYAGMVAGYFDAGSDSFGAIVSYASNGELYSKIGSNATDKVQVYEAGRGITVGGSIKDTTFTTFTDSIDQIEQYIGGVVGLLGANQIFDTNITTIIGVNFAGITSRVSVLGTKFVGAISGFTNAKLNSGDETTLAVAVQATDAGATGFNASMVAKVYAGISSVNNISLNNINYFADSDDTDKLGDEKGKYKFNPNYFTFGDFSNLVPAYTIMEVGDNASRNMFTYVNRRRLNEYANTANDSTSFYGDFVVAKAIDNTGALDYIGNNGDGKIDITMPDGIKFVRAILPKGEQGVSVRANTEAGFASFMEKTASGYQLTNNVFYAFHFTSNGFIYQEDISDVTESQAYLDEYFNIVNPKSMLYPIVIDRGMSLTSRSTDILTIDQSGRLAISRTGLAQINLASILDINNSLNFYIYVVDYFNSDNSKSIIYPSLSNSAVAIDDSILEIYGDSNLNLYVRPVNDIDAREDNNIKWFIQDGVLSNKGTNINLNSNEVVTTQLKIYRNKLDSEGNVVYEIDSETGDFKVDQDGNKIPVKEYVYDTTGFETVARNEVDVLINGQTISINHNDRTKEYGGKDENIKYYVEFSPILNVVIAESATVRKQYVCYVNKKLTNVEMRYLKGAKSIKSEYNTIAMTTAREAYTEIEVLSTRQEEEPSYVIARNGKAIFSTYAGVDLGSIEEQLNACKDVFKLTFVPLPSENISNELTAYKFKLQIIFNTSSEIYKNRYNENIYGEYTIELYASTDPSKVKVITINLQKTTVETISIDNYSDINQTDATFSSTSKIAIPGKSGLLAITLTPQDCDFDYISIENDELCYQEGNGVANFSLVSRPNSGRFEFTETAITGTSIARGVRFSLQDLLDAYGTSTGDDNAMPFDGVIYLRYNIGTNGVGAQGITKFNVYVGTDNQPPAKESIELQLKIEFKANVDIVGKTPVVTGDTSVHATYQVARGLRYELSLDDIWGFSRDNVTLSVDSQFAKIEKENDRYYLVVTSNDITYPGDYATFNIIARAKQQDGEILRETTSITQIQVLEYVVDYNYELAKDADIVSDMANGVVNVRIGNKQALSVDLYQFIEYDDSIASVRQKVESFMASMTEGGRWILYTNLLADGSSTNEGITTETASSRMAIGKDIQFTNTYMTVSDFNVVPRRTHNPRTPYYLFTYEGSFTIRQGQYVCNYNPALTTQSNIVKTEFSLNVFQSSSEETPIPIDTYEDLMNMQAGANYILLQDIIIPNSTAVTETPFAPINTAIASLDGNSYSITFNGVYDLGNVTNMGLFGQVSDQTVLKNVKVVLGGDVNFRTTSQNAYYAGLLAGANSGIITNCSVESAQNETLGENFTFKSEPKNLGNQSFMAGLVGDNSGNITNSRASLNILSSYNAGGLVGVNTGKIAGCYFKGGRIEVDGTGYALGGLVVVNRGDSQNENTAVIRNSYVSGETESAYVFSRDKENILVSSSDQAGFVYSNTGRVLNCYSNINIEGSSTMAGFVHDNGGYIENSFSLSILTDRATSSAGFVMNNQIVANSGIGTSESATQGVFDKCYYFVNRKEDIENVDGNGISAGYPELGELNDSIVPRDFPGVSKLNRKGFSREDENFEEHFGTFAVYNMNEINANAVWFYSEKGKTSKLYDEVEFNGERFELVSANLIARGRRELISDRDNVQDNGEILYEYADSISDEYFALGSQRNPYLIKNANDMENLIYEERNALNLNNKHYRFINDIDYSEYPEPSKLYEVTFCGSIEGNGMNVRNILLASASSLDKAGMFAQIGNDSNSIGVVMNFNVYPATDIAFTNTTIVGGLAGVLKNGYIFNVNISRDDNVVNVAGANFVGGLIGRAEGNYMIFNSSSDLSAVANYIPPEKVSSYEISRLADTEYSYAGGLVGYATGGRGQIKKIVVEDVNTVMGGRAGLAFGGVGKDILVQNMIVRPTTETKLRAYEYGAYVAGEDRGHLDIVKVETSAAEQTLNSFEIIPEVPVAVGGVVGVMYGGQLSRIDMQQAFTINSQMSSGSSSVGNVDNIGGIVGDVYNNISLDQIIVSGREIIARRNLGGVIGKLNGGYVTMNQIAVKVGTLKVEGLNGSSQLAGFVGETSDGSILDIYDSYCTSNLVLNCYTYTSDRTANVSGFVCKHARLLNMQRCFFSGTIDVTLEDYRVSSEPKDVTSSGEHNNYTANLANGSNIKDVYYFGQIKEDVDGAVDGSLGGSVKFKSNAEIDFSNLTVTMFGQASCQMLGTEINANQDALNNLFDYYIWTREKTIIGDNGEPTTVTEQVELVYNSKLDRYYEYGTLNWYSKLTNPGEDDKNDDNLYLGGQKQTNDGQDNPYIKLEELSRGGLETNGHENVVKVWLPVKDDFSILLFETIFDDSFI